MIREPVALRKESVDRNIDVPLNYVANRVLVALRKESVELGRARASARRAWIEMVSC